MMIWANGKNIEWLIDSGSEVNLMNKESFNKLHLKMKATDMTIVGANGGGIKCIRERKTSFMVA